MKRKLMKAARIFYLMLGSAQIGLGIIGLNGHIPQLGLGMMTVEKFMNLFAILVVVGYVFYGIFLGLGIVVYRHDDIHIITSWGCVAISSGVLLLHLFGLIRMDRDSWYVAMVVLLFGIGFLSTLLPQGATKTEHTNEVQA